MPVPTSYTETTLADFMHDALGNVAGALGYSSPTSYSEAVNDTLLAYGTDDISTISGQANIIKLRALSKVFAWRKAVGDLSSRYKFSADGGSYERQQMFENAKATLAMLEEAALVYDTNYAVITRKVDHIHDPYQVRNLDERPL